MSPPAAAEFSALLLAGGRSRRMGRDKALLEIAGQPLWLRQARLLASLHPRRLLISCREEQGLHETAGKEAGEWLFDPPGASQGPLGAIQRGLTQVKMPLLVLAADMPLLTAEFCAALLQESRAAECGLCLSVNGRFEPLAAVYTPAILQLLDAAAATGALALQPLIARAAELGLAAVREAQEHEKGVFRNVNTPEDWDELN